MKNEDNNDIALGKLIEMAGERPEIPLSVESRVYHNVQKEWRSATAERTGEKIYDKVHKTWLRDRVRGALLRWSLPVMVAASMLVAVFVFTDPATQSAPSVASVSRVVAVNASDLPFAEGAKIYPGQIIETTASQGMSLLLSRNESLRIDEKTQLRVDGDGQFTLLAGRIYADTGQFAYRGRALRVDTAFGVVTDVGTQFSVASDSESLIVAVREGRVDVSNESQTTSARLGEQLLVRSGEEPAITAIDTHDPAWAWAADLAPVFDISNRSLMDFLNWAARETGRELQFGSDEVRMFAMRTDVHGSIEGLTPEQALSAILATTSVNHRIETDKVVIE